MTFMTYSMFEYSRELTDNKREMAHYVIDGIMCHWWQILIQITFQYSVTKTSAATQLTCSVYSEIKTSYSVFVLSE